MFEVFPVINLTDQENVVNQAIISNSLTKEEVLYWLDYYGVIKMVLLDKRIHFKRYNIGAFLKLCVDEPKHSFSYKSLIGYFDVFNFSNTSNELEIMSRGWTKSFR